MKQKQKETMIDIQEFTRIAENINLSKFCRDCDLKYITIWTKINRGSQFTIKEATTIAKQLTKLGIAYAEATVLTRTIRYLKEV